VEGIREVGTGEKELTAQVNFSIRGRKRRLLGEARLFCFFFFSSENQLSGLACVCMCLLRGAKENKKWAC
jgi:hypothetical protein